jgi:periplasmic mercuric ion binding protein
MKAVQLIFLSLFAFTTMATAQQKAVAKAVISIPAAQCEECKNRIELYVGRQYGVSSINVNFRKKNATVVWNTDRTDIEQIKTHIANCGYDADDVVAEERAQKKLPPACKHPVPVKPPQVPVKE